VEFTVEQEQDLTLPEDSIHTARLTEVKPNVINWVDKNTGEPRSATLLDWWFEITETTYGDQYIGRRVKGSTDSTMSNHPRNKLRGWFEAMLQRDIGMGMKVNSDDIVGLPCEIVIGHRPDRKDPAKIWEEVTDVAPASGTGGRDLEPPF
jgi:hypothetical protein